MSLTIKNLKSLLVELLEAGNNKKFLKGTVYGLYLSQSISIEEKKHLDRFLYGLLRYENIRIIVKNIDNRGNDLDLSGDSFFED